MRVKRYLVDSMPDALEKIRLELGKDAVILNTKQVKIGGFLGLFGKQQIEVIAASDNKTPSSSDSFRQGERVMGTVAPAIAKKVYQQKQAASPQTEREPILSAAASLKADASVAVATKPRTASLGEEAVKTEPTQTVAQHSQNEAELANELRSIREMFHKLLLDERLQSTLPESLAALRDRLLMQSVDQTITNEIISQLVHELKDPKQASWQEVQTRAREMIISRLKKGTSRPPGIASSVRFAYFFGPTGVGKTTTIAKLAAESMLHQRRKVGFITSDTFRIAAVEQLKTYANILNAPLEVVFSPKEVAQAVERLSDCDLIFIDTAGRNYRNNEYVSGMKEYLQDGEQSENFLVLSLTSKDSDLQAIITNFNDIPAAKAVFTKSDETDSYGSILNVICQHNLSLSYMTNGQNVPADIVVATPELIATMILGEDVDA